MPNSAKIERGSNSTLIGDVIEQMSARSRWDKLYGEHLHPGEDFVMLSAAMVAELRKRLPDDVKDQIKVHYRQAQEAGGTAIALLSVRRRIINAYYANLPKPQQVRFLRELDIHGQPLVQPTGLGFPVALKPAVAYKKN